MAAIKHSRLSIEQKLEIISFVNSGNSQTAAAIKLGLSRPAVVSNMQKASQLQEACKIEVKSVKRNNVGYDGKATELDKVYDWHLRIENDVRDLNITQDILKIKALYFRDLILSKFGDTLKSEVKLSLQSFKASNGWLIKFIQRTMLRTICR